MTQEPEPLEPTAVIAARVRELREQRGWSAARLAGEMQHQGLPWERVVVTKLETGRRGSVSVVELLALAAVLECSPLHLLVPPLPQPAFAADGEADDTAPYWVTPAMAVPCYRMRQFIRAYEPLPGMALLRFIESMPPHEQPPGEEIKRRIRVEKERHIPNE